MASDLQTELMGSQYDNYQHLVNEPYAEQLKKLKQEYDIDNINFSDLKLTQRKDANPLTAEKMKLTIDKYVAKTDGHLYLIPNAFNQGSIIPEAKNRTLPVYINRGYTDEDEISYKLPAGYNIEHQPENKMIATPFGVYATSIERKGDELIYKRKLTVFNGTFPAADYERMVDFYSAITANDKAKVVLNSKAN